MWFWSPCIKCFRIQCLHFDSQIADVAVHSRLVSYVAAARSASVIYVAPDIVLCSMFVSNCIHLCTFVCWASICFSSPLLALTASIMLKGYKTLFIQCNDIIYPTFCLALDWMLSSAQHRQHRLHIRNFIKTQNYVDIVDTECKEWQRDHTQDLVVIHYR